MKLKSMRQIVFILSILISGLTDLSHAQVAPGEYEIIARHSGKCLDVPRSSTANGVGIIQYERNYTTNQIWKIYEGPAGYYTIRAKHSGKSLDVEGSSTRNSAAVIQFQCFYTYNQQWKLIDLGNGYYEIRARHSDKCLNVEGSSTRNEARIIQFTSYRTLNQQWQLQYVGPISETIQGTSGRDEIYFGYDENEMRLKVVLNNQVSLFSTAGNSFKIDGGSGHDIIKAIHDDEINGHKFNNLYTLSYAQFDIIGGAGNDRIVGTPFNDVIQGGIGDDHIDGNPGDDRLYGGAGTDVIYGSLGKDALIGGDGNDYLFGNQGADLVHGNCGNDILVGGSRDTLIGGIDYDTRHCRTIINRDERYDTFTDYNDYPCDCTDPSGIVDVENTHIRDPYNDWALMFFFKIVDGILIRIEYSTTSSVEQMLRERASLLMHNGEPLHTIHKQYDKSCGPSSLAMVMEYLGLANRSQRVQFNRDLDIATATPIFNRSWNSLLNVDVGYFLSTEHIMYEGYHRRYHHGDPLPDGYLDSRNRLDTDDHSQTGHFKEIDYPIGNVEIASDGTVTGHIQKWLKNGPPVGMLYRNQDCGLAYIANKFVSGNKDAILYHAIDDFANLEHIKSVIRGFIDHNLPLLTVVHNGGHFNVLMGYKESGALFYVYLAEPLDGWGNPYYNKPMRWRKILLTNNVLRSGLICGFMVFNHSNTDNGCARGGWARAIDETYGREILCGYFPMSTENEQYSHKNLQNTFYLSQNYPNPFNQSSLIRYAIPRQQHATLEIINILGQEVVRLVDRQHAPGQYSAIWDGKNAFGNDVNSGVYYFRLQTTDRTMTRKMLLLK